MTIRNFGGSASGPGAIGPPMVNALGATVAELQGVGRSRNPRRNRADGMRVRLSRIKGTTLGGAARVLETPYYFQCPPMDSFTHQHGFNHPTYQVATGQEFSQVAGRKLVTVQFKTLVVEWARFALYADWDTEGLTQDLLTISDEGWPFHLICTDQFGTDPELEIDATMEALAITQNAGESDARYYDITFQEWIDPVTSVKSRTAPKRKGSKSFPFTIELKSDGGYSWPSAFKHPPKSHALDFATIAKYAYGHSSYASHIAHAQKPSMTSWGNHTPLIKAPRFRRHGGKIIVPAPPKKK